MTVRYTQAERLTQDDFGSVFTRKEGEVVYDAKTKQGPWATMTSHSFIIHGCGKLGTGYGQKYVRNAAGEFMKMEG